MCLIFKLGEILIKLTIIAREKHKFKKMNKKQRIKLYNRALKQNGLEIQLCVCSEEITELQESIYNTFELMGDRSNLTVLRDTILEELVDVEIMLEQLQNIFEQKITKVEKSKPISSIKFRDICADLFRCSNILSKHRRNKNQENEIITYVIPTLYVKVSFINGLFSSTEIKEKKNKKLLRLKTKLDNNQK
jgi:hypothetical protein